MTEATAPKPDAETDKRQRAQVEALLARPAITATGALATINGRQIDYAVCAEFLPVAVGGIGSQRGEPQAAVFSVAYLAKSASDQPRPLCFAFNGGPGSSSVWLHLGVLGPKRVVIPDDGAMPAPPYAVVDNPLSWLEHFDLVFIDPPHTGYSLSSGDEARKKMLSVDGDIEALTEVIRGWLSRHGRFASTLYLAGESYGTTRAAGIADKLLDQGIALAGLVLISCAMDLQSLVFAPGNDLPYALFLPAFAGVAQFHGRLRGPLAASAGAARKAAEDFVEQDYLAALHAGARLSASARQRIARRVAELTGLSEALVTEKNLRISDETFFFELLRDQGLQVGRLDARVTGLMAASRSRTWEFDPGMEALVAPYSMAMLAYLAELGLPADGRYYIFSMDAHKAWDWNRGEEKGNSFTCTSTDLARALRRNPHLRVLVASGRFDLGTPYSASDWALARLDVPAEVLARVSHHHYDAGHMMYTRSADLRQLRANLVGWLES
jgi:carboxypeptidase C (cathepsin A)